jgi:hypothetical protein
MLELQISNESLLNAVAGQIQKNTKKPAAGEVPQALEVREQ